MAFNVVGVSVDWRKWMEKAATRNREFQVMRVMKCIASDERMLAGDFCQGAFHGKALLQLLAAGMKHSADVRLCYFETTREEREQRKQPATSEKAETNRNTR